MIPEKELDSRLIKELKELLSNQEKYDLISQNLKALAKPKATQEIVDDILSMLKSNKKRK